MPASIMVSLALVLLLLPLVTSGFDPAMRTRTTCRMALHDHDNLERGVISSVKKVASSGFAQPKLCAEALGEFGSASGDLVQTWLTPEKFEECWVFWDDGARALARDVRRFDLLRFNGTDAAALGWFTLLSSGTFPFTPLLLVSKFA